MLDLQPQKLDMNDILPLDLTVNAATQYPSAIKLAHALESDEPSLEVVKNYLIRKHSLTSEEAIEAIRAYLKYLVLTVSTRKSLAPSEVADMAWHAHILHTLLYGPWCQHHFGRFIHHVPSGPDEHPSDEFQAQQNSLGVLFFGEHTIYKSASGHCSNTHSCLGPDAPSHCGSHCGSEAG